MKNKESGVVVLAVLFIALFSGLLGMVVGSNHFAKNLPSHQEPSEYK